MPSKLVFLCTDKKKKDANENITADKESSSSTNKKNIKVTIFMLSLLPNMFF